MFQDHLTSFGIPPYWLDQIHDAIYREMIQDFTDISGLPNKVQNVLSPIPFSVLELKKIQKSPDGNTEKALLRTQDGKYIESVLMHHKGRKTVCVSSQIGCPAGCVFCATGKMGSGRNLSAREIVEQVLFWNRRLHQEWRKKYPNAIWNAKNPPQQYRVRNVVFMGMGEPMLNYENVIEAIKVFIDQKKFGISLKRITVSTVGIIPGIEKLMQENLGVSLALSLHAATEELRNELVPINTAYPLTELMTVCDDYTAQTGERIFYEYVVMAGKNDRTQDAENLGKLLSGRPAHVNFIPYNVNEECDDDLRRPSEKNIRAMQKILEKYSIPSTLRLTMGDEMAAACGQLANKTS